MDFKLYLYSATNLKISDLKQLTDFSNDFVEKAKLNEIKKFMDRFDIKGAILDSPLYHFKFLNIFSKPYIYYFK
jgi:hypothetical protein